MKKHWITFTEEWQAGPMSYWVHIEADGKNWYAAKEFKPPKPKPVPARGYPVFHVEFDGFTFQFQSLDELRVCIDTLAKKVLPTSARLSAERGTGYGPSNNWLNRLPRKVKPWRYQQRAIVYLQKSLADFEAELSG